MSVGTADAPSTLVRDAGSFRDPSGHVFQRDGRTFRTVTRRGIGNYRFAGESGFLAAAIERGHVVGSREIDPTPLGDSANGAEIVLEHETLPFVSYPYEWSFELLKAAALFHLNLHKMAMAYGVTLSDASAYNVQFKGTRPVFIDVLSFRQYRAGEYWSAHRQFCEQFLNPLLMRSCLGVAHNAFYRGALDGIGVEVLSQLIPLRRKLASWNLFSQVHLQARLQARARADEGRAAVRAYRKKLPTRSYLALLDQLAGWIAGLRPRDRRATEWGEYARGNSYDDAETAAKKSFVAGFTAAEKPALLWDLGCNEGLFSRVALENGAKRAVGFDFDQAVLDAGYLAAKADGVDFLPLFLDAANPSPSQGWGLAERKSLTERSNADAVLALAFEHHMAIGRNIPLDQLVRWIVGLAPAGVIEFVQKSDPMVGRLLSLREDIFDDYEEATFLRLVERDARIVKLEQVSRGGRKLIWFDRR